MFSFKTDLFFWISFLLSFWELSNLLLRLSSYLFFPCCYCICYSSHFVIMFCSSDIFLYIFSFFLIVLLQRFFYLFVGQYFFWNAYFCINNISFYLISICSINSIIFSMNRFFFDLMNLILFALLICLFGFSIIFITLGIFSH